MGQQTPAQLVAQIVEADGRSHYHLEQRAGIAHGAIRAWLDGRQCPVAGNLIALANTCGVEIVARPMDGGG